MRPDRELAIGQVLAGKLSRAKAAKILGLSRQRVGVIVKGRQMKTPPPAAPTGAAPSPPPPPASGGGPANAAAGAWAAPEGRSSLEDLLKQANAGAPGAPPPPPPLVMPTGAPGADPEELEAGRELVGMATGGLGRAVAVDIFGASPEDPRLAPLEKPTKFMDLALKRNEGKCAFAGKLTGGWIGLLIGTAVEVWRAVRLCRRLGLEPPPAAPQKPAGTPAAAQAETDPEEDVPLPGEDPTEERFSITAAKTKAAEGKL